MSGIDWYKSVNMDASVILNYPKGMPGVVSALVALLASRNKIVVDEGAISMDRTRQIIEGATGDIRTYFQINNPDPDIWEALSTSVNEDRIRVLGIFHGRIPDSVPENVVTLDVGKSMHQKVSKPMATDIMTALSSKGKYPVGDQEEVYEALLTLCFEVLYSPEYRVFKKETASLVPVSRAFDFMYNPPTPLTKILMASATVSFVEDIHSWIA